MTEREGPGTGDSGAIIDLFENRPRPHVNVDVNKLECSACGALADAACDCGTPYVPAGERAAAALKANPSKSDRVIAGELGVSSNTVRRARPATAPHGAVEKRIGKDGRARRLPAERMTRATVADDVNLGDVEKGILKRRYLMRATKALRFAVYIGPVDEEVIHCARNVAQAWEALVQKLEKSL